MSYPQPYPYGGGYPAPPPAAPNNGLAIASLISGIASWVALPLVGGAAAVVFGHLAQRQIRETGQSGSGMAVAGLVLGYLNVVMSILFICLFGAIALGCLASVAWIPEIDPSIAPTPEISSEPFPSPTPEPLPTG
jgi:hypothetical protein